MNRNTITKIILLIVLFIVFTKTTENFWSRPNKCFDCEKDIKSMKDANLAFPSKCFSCEKQVNKESCMPVDNSEYKFETYMRNRFPNRS